MIPGLLTLILLSAVVAYIGKNRKFGFWCYFACSFILTPIIGLVIVLASDRKSDAVAA
jgi:hypothetical protein